LGAASVAPFQWGFDMAIVHKDYDPLTGITSIVHETETKVTIEKKYDATGFLEHAAQKRAETAGEKWGEMRHVGTVPMAELATMLRQDGRIDMKRMAAWLKANPKLVTFDRFLK
jgi:hypothetical protein